MSQPKHDQPDDARDASPATPPRDASQLGPVPETEQPAAATGLEYVFKIAPADPKRTLDFEDVADK